MKTFRIFATFKINSCGVELPLSIDAVFFMPCFYREAKGLSRDAVTVMSATEKQLLHEHPYRSPFFL